MAFMLLLLPYLFIRRGFGLVLGRAKRNEVFQQAGLMSTYDYLRKIRVPHPVSIWIDLVTRFGYESRIVRALSKIRGGVFLDVGAGTGYYAVILSRNFRSVLAFEPEPKNFSTIRDVARIGRLGTIRVMNVAISDYNGATVLYRSGTLWHSLIRGFKEDTGIRVPTITLDSAIREDVDLLKVDVEGTEWEVLKGAETSIRARKVRRIMVEIHDKTKKAELEDYLRSRAYLPTWLDSNHVLATLSNLESNEIERRSSDTSNFPLESTSYSLVRETIGCHQTRFPDAIHVRL